MGEIIIKVKPAISVVVPVYNAGKSLRKCLDSIFSQEFDYPYEVIAVNDYSIDDSSSILIEYKKKYSNLVLIENQENLKLSVTRKKGIIVSSGEYLMHVDSDDYLLPDAFKKLFEKCKETDADVVVFNYVRKDSNKEIVQDVVKEEILTKDKHKVQNLFFGSVWNKIIKKSIAENLIYGKISVNSTEDLLYSTEILLKVNSICLFPDSFYVYHYNIDSLSASVTPKKYFENQILVLTQIEVLFNYYDCSKKFKVNVIDYFEKWLYLELTKSHFFFRSSNAFEINILLERFSSSIYFENRRLIRLKSSSENKIKCLFVTFKYFGFTYVVKLILFLYMKKLKINSLLKTNHVLFC